MYLNKKIINCENEVFVLDFLKRGTHTHALRGQHMRQEAVGLDKHRGESHLGAIYILAKKAQTPLYTLYITRGCEPLSPRKCTNATPFGAARNN